MSTSKNRILDAAERVVMRDGGAHLTLDAVAAEAAISKGGLLYHFPSKDELVRSMIARLQDEFEAEMQRLASADTCAVGRLTRAYLNTIMMRGDSAFGARLDQISAALLAAVATNRSLLEPMHERGESICSVLDNDGIDPVIATIARLAADGLWMAGLFGAPPLNPEMRARVIAKLDELTRPV